MILRNASTFRLISPNIISMQLLKKHILDQIQGPKKIKAFKNKNEGD